jgi:hypothetical protein
MVDTCVVYLVWGRLGFAPVERFAASYRQHPAGLEHRLVLLLNGVEDDALRLQCHMLGDALGAQLMELEEPVLDLDAYLTASHRLSAETLCFLNSYSEILADDWLAALRGGLKLPNVGLAGATGSWASQLDYLRYQLHLPSHYATVFSDREATRQAFLELARESDPSIRDRGRLAAQLLTTVMLARQTRTFTRFPTPHLRTNAFAVRRKLLLAIRPRPIRSKLDAYRLESGRDSLTARVAGRGLRAVVVGRDGVCYETSRWAESDTLWQGDQRNLLVADNRTEDYRRAGRERRLLLARLAWGERAQPGPS